MEAHPITVPRQALAFIFAGNARVTLRSKKSGTRYTYRVRVCEDKPNLWFISLLTGADNEGDYQFIGHCHGTGPLVHRRGTTRHKALDALTWAVQMMRYRNMIPTDLEVWHEGRCGRCARVLTVPESIETGFGPECVKKAA